MFMVVSALLMAFLCFYAFPYSTFFLNFLLSWTFLAPLVVAMNLEDDLFELA